MLYSKVNIGDESIPSMMNVGNVVGQRRRSTPLCYRMTSKSLLNEYDVRMMLMHVTFEGRQFKAVSETAGIPGEDVKLWLSIYYGFVVQGDQGKMSGRCGQLSAERHRRTRMLEVA